MSRHLKFADATASFEDARFVILGIPFDRTTTFRPGARFAPNAIREASHNFETYLIEHDVDLCDIPIHDLGNTEEFGSAQEMIESVKSETDRIVDADKFLILLGGEHSVTIPGLKSMFSKHSDLGVIFVDAHLDFRTEYLNERWGHACTLRRAAELVGFENTVTLGVRSVSKEEMNDLKPGRPCYITAFEIREKGLVPILKKLLRKMRQPRLYLSIDIDGIDPAYAPGTGTPEPFGLTPFEIKILIAELAPRLAGFDIVEVCPPCDNGNTSALAARLVREVIATVWKSYTMEL